MISLVTVIVLLPSSVSFGDAVFLAGAAGRLNAVTTNFDWNDRFNIWSGLIGGTFLFLSYFGCDQSQVQRYLTGKSIAQSRLSLLFNAVAKIPMQFFILFIGAMVFVFYLFVQPPLLFQQAELTRIGARCRIRADERALPARLRAAPAGRAGAGGRASRGRCRGRRTAARDEYRAAQQEIDAARTSATKLVESSRRREGLQRHQLHLSFVRDHATCPSGVVGLVIAVIFAATMSASSGEINSLATVTVIDIYQRHFRRGASDHHYLMASRWPTLFWGVYAVVFAGWAKRLGSLIVAVNMVGSLFYGSLLGCFVLAILLPAGARHGACSSACWRAKRRSSAHCLVHQYLLALVQRDRLRGGDG